jgi:hypothetical protein
LRQDDVLKLNVFAINPGVSIIEFYHIESFLCCNESRSQLKLDFLLGEQQLLHLHFALEVTEIVQSNGNVKVLDIYLEVEEGILIVYLDYSECCLS